MNSRQILQTIFLSSLLLSIGGCGKDGNENDVPKDHVLRQQIDTMRDAQSLTDTLNKKTAEEEREADELVGHN